MSLDKTNKTNKYYEVH